MIAIGPAKLLDGETTPTELRVTECTSMMTIQMIKQQPGRALGFPDVDGAVVISVYGSKGARPRAATRKRCRCRYQAREPNEK